MNCQNCGKALADCTCGTTYGVMPGSSSSWYEITYEHPEHAVDLPKPNHQIPIPGWGRPACECGQRDEFGIKHSDYCRLSKHPNPEEKLIIPFDNTDDFGYD